MNNNEPYPITFPNVHIDPAICLGQPRIAGTRITVSALLKMLLTGTAVNDLPQFYPELTVAQAREALLFSAHLATLESYTVAGSGEVTFGGSNAR